MAVATAAYARCAGAALSRQLSARSGQSIQVPACGSHSAGIRNPSFAGVGMAAILRDGVLAFAHERENPHRKRQAPGTGSSGHSIHRGRRHRPRHLARERARPRRRREECVRRQAPDRVEGSLRGREGQQAPEHLAARRDRRGLPRVPRLDQGPAHDSDRRRHPLAERRAAPDAGPLRLPASRALVQGRALARALAGKGRHGDLPREHGGHLRRHRIRGGFRGQRESSSRS